MWICLKPKHIPAVYLLYLLNTGLIINKRIIWISILILFAFKTGAFDDTYVLNKSTIDQWAEEGDTVKLNLDPELILIKYNYSNSSKIAGKIWGYEKASLHIENNDEEGWNGYLVFLKKQIYYKITSEGDKVIFSKVNQEDIFQE